MGTKQKIYVAVTNDLNQDQRMHRICSSFFEAGYDVHLIGRQRKQSQPLLDMPFQQKRIKCIFDRGFLFYLEYNLRLFFHLLFSSYDMGYAVDLDTLGSVGAASQMRRKPLIFDAHEYFTEVPELEGKRFKKWIWHHIGLWFVDYAALNITVNQELVIILSKKYKKPFEVVRSVPYVKDVEIPQQKDKILLYQGVLNKGRGLEQAIEAMKHLDDVYRLHIAGGGDVEAQLKAKVINLKLEHRVHFLGWLNPEELRAQTRKAYIGLNLLDGSSLNYKYSLANKFFDYMHAGVPSLNMEFPVYKRILRKHPFGKMVARLSPKEIAEAIMEMSEEQRYANYVSACEVAKAEYSWQRESEHLIRLIEKIGLSD